MTIKGMDGQSYEVTGSGQGIYNSIGASAGILSLIGGVCGMGSRGGLFGGNNAPGFGCCDGSGMGYGRMGYGMGYGMYGDVPVTRYDANLMINNSAKDAEIANLRSDKETDRKMVEVYTALNRVDNQQRDRMDLMYKDISERLAAERESRLQAEKEQAVYNEKVIGGMATMKQQIARLDKVIDDITTNVVPQRKVCDTGCGCNQ